MLPVVTAFMAAHSLTDVIIVADAGISKANQWAIENIGQSLSLGTRIPDDLYAIASDGASTLARSSRWPCLRPALVGHRSGKSTQNVV